MAGMKRYAAKGCWPAVAGREVVNDRKAWCSVKNQAGKVLAGCDRKGVCRLARMPGVTVLPAGAG